EVFWDSPGLRIFDVDLNGKRVLTDFDVFATTGGRDIAIVEPFVTQADANGQITIVYSAAPQSPDQNAKSSGIEVIPEPTSNPLFVTPVAAQAFDFSTTPFTLATFFDADPAGNPAGAGVTIKWSDGTTSTGTVQPDPKIFGLFDVIGSHSFAPGNRSAVVT